MINAKKKVEFLVYTDITFIVKYENYAKQLNCHYFETMV